MLLLNHDSLMFTFHVIQGVSQHFKDGHIQRITEGLVEQIRRWIHL